jgi:hypothetical protein
MIPRSKLFAALLVLSLGAACGGGSAASDTGGGGADGEGLSVAVDKPADGATVSVPFTVELSSSVPLGTTDTGRHHVHLYYDGDAESEDYDVVESNTYEVDKLPPGEHTILASLRNADHSPAGAETEITITVETSQNVKEGTGENDTGDDKGGAGEDDDGDDGPGY